VSTLAELESALRRELETDELLDLEEDFYSKIRKLLTDIHQIRNKSLEIIPILEERVCKTVEKLFLIRLKKELEHLLRYGEIPKKSIPKEEHQILINIMKIISTITQFAIEEAKIVSENKICISKIDFIGKLSLVVFRKTYPKLLISDKGVLGPFSPGDIAIVPEAVANELKKLQVLDVIAEFEA